MPMFFKLQCCSVSLVLLEFFLFVDKTRSQEVRYNATKMIQVFSKRNANKIYSNTNLKHRSRIPAVNRRPQLNNCDDIRLNTKLVSRWSEKASTCFSHIILHVPLNEKAQWNHSTGRGSSLGGQSPTGLSNLVVHWGSTTKSWSSVLSDQETTFIYTESLNILEQWTAISQTWEAHCILQHIVQSSGGEFNPSRLQQLETKLTTPQLYRIHKSNHATKESKAMHTCCTCCLSCMQTGSIPAVEVTKTCMCFAFTGKGELKSTHTHTHTVGSRDNILVEGFLSSADGGENMPLFVPRLPGGCCVWVTSSFRRVGQSVCCGAHHQ